MTYADDETCLACSCLANDHTRAGCLTCGCALTLTEDTNTCLAELPSDHFGRSLPLFRYQDGGI